MLDLLLASILAAVEPAGTAPVPPAAPEVPTAVLPAAVTAPSSAATAPPAPVTTPPAAAGPDELSAPTVPPSIATKAFLDEVRGAGREQRVSRQRTAEERARLEKVLKEINGAREALRLESARLEKASKEIGEEREALRLEKARVEAQFRSLAERPSPQPESPPPSTAARSPGAPQTAGGTPAIAPEKPPHEALAKTLKGMRPERAAEVVARLDPALAVSLLRRSRPGDVAAILEKLKPEAAADIVARLATPEGTVR